MLHYHLSVKASAFRLLRVTWRNTIGVYSTASFTTYLPGWYLKAIFGRRGESSLDEPRHSHLLLQPQVYNSRRKENKQNSDYNLVQSQDMIDVPKFSVTLIKLGTHGHIFCSVLQFTEYIHFLKEFTETIVHEHSIGRTMTREENMFGRDIKSLVYVRRNANNNVHRTRRSIHKINMTEIALHLWRTGLDSECDLEFINDAILSLFSFEHAGNSNVICRQFQRIIQCAKAVKCYSGSQAEKNRTQQSMHTASWTKFIDVVAEHNAKNHQKRCYCLRSIRLHWRN